MLVASFARTDNGSNDWVRAHEALSRLAKERAAADAEEGRWLLCALRSAAHIHLGFASFAEYIERLFGYKPRSTQEKLRVAEALEALPGMANSLESGSLSWSAVRELTRVAVAETERAWLEVASGKTVRQLERLIEGKRSGDEPGVSRPLSERRHVLRFEVEPETFALFQEAMTQLRRRTGSILDDDSALLLMAREALGGPADAGRASYQIALSLCAQCGSAEQQAGGKLVAVGADVIEQARCDGQHLGYIAAPVANENAAVEGIERNEDEHTRVRLGSDVDAAPAHLNAAVEGHDAQVGDAHVGAEGHPDAGDGDAHVGVKSHHDAQVGDAHVSAKGHPDAQVGDARMGAERHGPHAQAHPRTAAHGARQAPRAKQTIPPALRRAVLRRDHEHCQVPGCSHAAFLDLHHIALRSEGGRHELENIITMCAAHHRAAHRGELLIAGTATKPHFRHADGSEYGHAERPQTIDAQTRVFSALRHLGFRERDIHAVLGELRKQNDLRQASTERLLREALQTLAPPRVKPIRS